ncbi:unnamed protein product [Ectocarpus sp. 6 AP-2014]
MKDSHATKSIPVCTKTYGVTRDPNMGHLPSIPAPRNTKSLKSNSFLTHAIILSAKSTTLLQMETRREATENYLVRVVAVRRLHCRASSTVVFRIAKSAFFPLLAKSHSFRPSSYLSSSQTGRSPTCVCLHYGGLALCFVVTTSSRRTWGRSKHAHVFSCDGHHAAWNAPPRQSGARTLARAQPSNRPIQQHNARKAGQKIATVTTTVGEERAAAERCSATAASTVTSVAVRCLPLLHPPGTCRRHTAEPAKTITAVV